jgi:hypothetical protein
MQCKLWFVFCIAFCTFSHFLCIFFFALLTIFWRTNSKTMTKKVKILQKAISAMQMHNTKKCKCDAKRCRRVLTRVRCQGKCKKSTTIPGTEVWEKGPIFKSAGFNHFYTWTHPNKLQIFQEFVECFHLVKSYGLLWHERKKNCVPRAYSVNCVRLDKLAGSIDYR